MLLGIIGKVMETLLEMLDARMNCLQFQKSLFIFLIYSQDMVKGKSCS